MLNSKQVFYESVDACTNAYLSYVREAKSATCLTKTIDVDGLGTSFSYRREDGDSTVSYETRVSLKDLYDKLKTLEMKYRVPLDTISVVCSKNHLKKIFTTYIF
jgi:hypothetical protein